jgi:hypothetical protein
MNPAIDYNELADRYVAVWNERNAESRRSRIKELWREDGIECTQAREVQGYESLEAQITASHEKNVRDGGHVFRSCRNAVGHHNLVKFNWEMIKTAGGSVEATGSYVLRLDNEGKIYTAWLFVDQ